MSNERILLVGGDKTVFTEVSTKVDALFPKAELVWLKTYTEVKKYFDEDDSAKIIFIAEEPSDYMGLSFLTEINVLSANLPVIFV